MEAKKPFNGVGQPHRHLVTKMSRAGTGTRQTPMKTMSMRTGEEEDVARRW